MRERLPFFLENFQVLGIKREMVGGLCETSYYVRGRCVGLKEFGQCSFLEMGWSGGSETKVMVRSVMAIAAFEVAETAISDLKMVA